MFLNILLFSHISFFHVFWDSPDLYQSQKGIQTMLTTIQSYAYAADHQDEKVLQEVFHKDFQVIALTKEGVRKLDKTTYINLIKAGKIGGISRVLTVVFSEHDENIGVAKVILRSEKAAFYDHLTLIKENGKWQIITNVTRVTSSENR